MTVTKIVPSKRQEGICHIYADGKYLFSCSDLELSRYNISAGNELDDGLAKELSLKYREAKAVDKAYELLSYRDHSRSELDTKLKARGFNDEERRAAFDSAAKMGVLDDGRFADAFAERLLKKGYGRRRIVRELYNKGVGREIVENLLQEKLCNENLAAIESLILKKMKNKETMDEKTRGSIVRALVSKGFEFSDIKEALSRWGSPDECSD